MVGACDKGFGQVAYEKVKDDEKRIGLVFTMVCHVYGCGLAGE